MTALVEAPTDAAAAFASMRETAAALADTLWAVARPEDLLGRFESVRRREQLDPSVAEMLRRAYV